MCLAGEMRLPMRLGTGSLFYSCIPKNEQFFGEFHVIWAPEVWESLEYPGISWFHGYQNRFIPINAQPLNKRYLQVLFTVRWNYLQATTFLLVSLFSKKRIRKATQTDKVPRSAYVFNNFATDSGKGYATVFGNVISKHTHKLAQSAQTCSCACTFSELQLQDFSQNPSMLFHAYAGRGTFGCESA